MPIFKVVWQVGSGGKLATSVSLWPTQMKTWLLNGSTGRTRLGCAGPLTQTSKLLTEYHATGTCWALEVPAGKRSYRHVFLLPVAKD
jgi:hypothetical protein